MTAEIPPIPKRSHLLTDPPFVPTPLIEVVDGQTEAFPAEPLPRQSVWWPYWKWADMTDVTKAAADMEAAGIDGVMLMGMEWGNDYALPKDIAAKLDRFQCIGIEPYLALWVGTLREEEAITAERAWKAGEGQWRGIILDAEHQWKALARDNPDLARTNFDAFMARVRPLTESLGYAPYGVPTFHKAYKYEWWNEVCDFVLPQIYFSGDDTADFILNRAAKSWASISADWKTPLKPMVPLGNCHGDNASTVERAIYGTRAIAEHGGVSWWRWPFGNPEMAPTLAGL